MRFSLPASPEITNTFAQEPQEPEGCSQADTRPGLGSDHGRAAARFGSSEFPVIEPGVTNSGRRGRRAGSVTCPSHDFGLGNVETSKISAFIKAQGRS